MLSDLHSDFLDQICAWLDRWEAANLLLVNKYVSVSAARAIRHGICRQRIVVASSKNKKLVEIDCMSGEIVRWAQTALNCQQSSIFRKPNRTPQWITSICFCPWDGDLYVCEYAISGVAVYSGQSLKYKKTFFSGCSMEHPEGLVFADNHCFIASAANESVVKVSMAGQAVATSILPGGIPWSLSSIPSDQGDLLLVTVDLGYEAKNYARAPDRRTGSIMMLRHDQSFGRSFPDRWRILAPGLSRPSGMWCHASVSPEGLATTHFGAEQWKALEMRPVSSKTPAGGRDEGLSAQDKQWDVCMVGGSFFVTVHTGGMPHRSRVHQYDLEGRLVRVIRSSHFYEANMMAVQH